MYVKRYLHFGWKKTYFQDRAEGVPNGGLIYLQPDIAKVFVIAEKQMSQKLTLQNALEDKFFLERNTAQIQRACMDLIPTLSERFDEHFSASFKKMVQIYVSTRCKFFCKDTNTEMKRNQTRQKLNRIRVV